MAKLKYYAVAKGRKTGIFTSWSQCEAQVRKFSGAVFKSFEDRAAAEAFLRAADSEQMPNSAPVGQSGKSSFIVDSICVDAACSGNPGIVEYRGVDTATREVIFQPSPIPQGTNNLGEFLAIVQGLNYLQQQGRDIPIYSDSATAMLWVKQKQVRTTLNRDARSAQIFDLIDRAIHWLQTHEYTTPILKWDTRQWGEIPADFGRK